MAIIIQLEMRYVKFLMAKNEHDLQILFVKVKYNNKYSRLNINVSQSYVTALSKDTEPGLIFVTLERS